MGFSHGIFSKDTRLAPQDHLVEGISNDLESAVPYTRRKGSWRAVTPASPILLPCRIGDFMPCPPKMRVVKRNGGELLLRGKKGTAKSEWPKLICEHREKCVRSRRLR